MKNPLGYRWDSGGFHGDSGGFHGDSGGFQGDSMVVFIGIPEGFRRIPGDSRGFRRNPPRDSI